MSMNNGQSWTAANSGLTCARILALAVDGSNLFAGTWDSVFISEDDGQSWSSAREGMTNTSISAISVNGTHFFAGTWGGGIFQSPDQG